MKKYEMTAEVLEWEGHTLYRIRSLRDFVTVTGKQIHAGDLGGFIEDKRNLSQEGEAWVADDAKVYGNAVVRCNANVRDRACVFDKAVVTIAAVIKDSAVVRGESQVWGFSTISEHATVSEHAYVGGEAKIGGTAQVSGRAYIAGTARLSEGTIEDELVLFASETASLDGTPPTLHFAPKSPGAK